MWVIAKRELLIFFSSGIGYLTLGAYLTVNTLFLWFFDTDFNILNTGFADLNSFFVLTPWLLILLNPLWFLLMKKGIMLQKKKQIKRFNT